MTTRIIAHPSCREHEPGAGHPESPQRLEAVDEALATTGIERVQAQRAGRDQLARVHDPAYIERVLASIPAEGRRGLDPDTLVSPGSGEAALRAAGAGCAAVDAVLGGQAETVFCPVRPPGHHAEPSRAMGFCLFNNVAVAAMHALETYGLRRVAVVDFDVHHGNGTQTVALREPRLAYVSSHEHPLFPGTGSETETADARVLNAPLPAGTDGRELRAVYDLRLLPAIEAFKPSLLLISAGFDGHRLDPLANFELTTQDFAWLTDRLVELAKRHCAGRVVSLLEGGYSLQALRECVRVHVEGLSAEQ